MQPRRTEDHVVGPEESICTVLVEAIAEAESTDPLDLDPPVYEVVDLEAIEQLFQPEGAHGSVRFTYRGYDVVVETDERTRLSITPTRSPNRSVADRAGGDD